MLSADWQPDWTFLTRCPLADLSPCQSPVLPPCLPACLACWLMTRAKLCVHFQLSAAGVTLASALGTMQRWGGQPAAAMSLVCTSCLCTGSCSHQCSWYVKGLRWTLPGYAWEQSRRHCVLRSWVWLYSIGSGSHTDGIFLDCNRNLLLFTVA